ncbi:MAG: translation elongation factor Ts [Candidatus Paceibacterota bacterium]
MPTQITTELVKELRDSTGISVMQCKRALEESDGDMKKALAILKKTSADIALKKGSREVTNGRVSIKMTGEKAALIALHCETDFVAKNEDFIGLLETLTEKAVSAGMETMKAGSKEMIDPVIQKTGENIQLGDTYEITGDILGSYVHNNHKIGVLVSTVGGNAELAKDIAMHIAAMKPEYISESEITEDDRKVMTEVFQKEVAQTTAPEDIKKKMLDGKLNTYFKEKTLLDQPFIKNPKETIRQLLEKSGASIKAVKRCSI